ncbi:unnamed protein product [Protopolystoma xenopodis]|uniref:Uncharacterized protein n=1 Tax=Protopolystoma xenopodis TaxID=117903 RepID=A0A3S5B2J5_9PLAT|nr:unnamed protein product [Protopolystoma xenopodis]
MKDDSRCSGYFLVSGEIGPIFTRNSGKCLVDCVNLKIVLKPNDCRKTGFSRRLLVRSTFEYLRHAISYELKVFPTISFQEVNQKHAFSRIYTIRMAQFLVNCFLAPLIVKISASELGQFDL